MYYEDDLSWLFLLIWRDIGFRMFGWLWRKPRSFLSDNKFTNTYSLKWFIDKTKLLYTCQIMVFIINFNGKTEGWETDLTRRVNLWRFVEVTIVYCHLRLGTIPRNSSQTLLDTQVYSRYRPLPNSSVFSKTRRWPRSQDRPKVTFRGLLFSLYFFQICYTLGFQCKKLDIFIRY